MSNKKLSLKDLNAILIVSREHELHDQFINYKPDIDIQNIDDKLITKKKKERH